MKVHELVTQLNKMASGADVVITRWNPRSEESDVFKIDAVDGGDVDGTVINDVNISMGEKA